MNNLVLFQISAGCKYKIGAEIKTSKCEAQISYCLSDLHFREVILNIKIKGEVVLSGNAYDSAYGDYVMRGIQNP